MRGLSRRGNEPMGRAAGDVEEANPCAPRKIREWGMRARGASYGWAGPVKMACKSL